VHYLLFYDFTPDYLARRGEYRNAHLQLAWQAQKRGELVLAGALADPADGGVLLFDCDSPSVPEQFAAGDPYVKNGLVRSWRVRLWTTVIGKDAKAPLKPEV
jgi:uncharacterized protein